MSWWQLLASAAVAAVVSGVIQRWNKRADDDARLALLFVDLMRKADGRGGDLLSEQAVSHLLGALGDATLDDASMRAALGSCVVSGPVGKSEIDAALVSIYTLAKRHRLLRKPALRGVKSLTHLAGQPLYEAVRGKLEKLWWSSL